MKVKRCIAGYMALVCGAVATTTLTARKDKPTDGGKGSAFKSKVYEIKEKGNVAVLLAFEADKEVIVTTDGEKETDVNLFIQDENKKDVGKDTSPGPKCEVKFTPKKDGKYEIIVKNKGPGTNKVTLAVKVAN